MKKEEFQIFFSGAEQPQWFKIITEQTNAVLTTFTWLERWGKKNMKALFSSKPDLRLIIDSGAYTINSNPEKYEDKDEEWFEEYLIRYTNLVREYKDHVFACVELDLDGFVPQETIEKWREKYFFELEKEGIQVIYVWHKEQGIDHFQEMCTEHNYLAFSCQEVDVKKDFSLMNQLFSEARKTNTLIHGLAATGVEVMTSFPFYTVDSSTYNVGSKYREITYFDGRALKRLMKDKYKTQYLNQLVLQGANREKLEREDIYELVRINIRNILLLEEYVRTINRNKSYWLEEELPISIKMQIEKGKIIPKGYENSSADDYQHYLESVGLPTNIDKEDAIALLITFRDFCSSDADDIIKTYTDEQIYNLAELFGIEGENYNTVNKIKDALIVCFRKHARGEIDILYQKLNKAYSVRREAKEREDTHLPTIQQDYLCVEMTEKEIDRVLKEYEDDNLDEEEKEDLLKQSNITVIRDEKGKFLKGQRLVRKPKKFLSDLTPKLSCDFCIKAQACPKYQSGYVCYYNQEFNKFDTQNVEDVNDIITSIINENISRLQTARMFEKIDGGILDPEVTKLSKDILGMLKTKTDLEVSTIKQIRVTDGKTWREETIISNPQKGSILNKLFKATKETNKKKKSYKTIDIGESTLDEEEDE